MRKLGIFAGLSLWVMAAVIALGQSQTVQGEMKRLSRIWDGTDVWLIDASGNGMVGDGTGPLTVDGTVTVTDGAGALNVVVDSGTVTANAGSGTFVVGDGAGALNVIVDSSALPSGAATAAAQLPDGHNVTVDNASGASAVNIQDGGNTITVDGTVTVGTFPDNEPINVAQMNGVAVTMGNGISGTGVQRVTIASDTTGVVQVKGQNSTSPIYCTEHAFLNMTTATTTQIVALSGSTVIYVCSYAIHVGGAADVKLVSGTGTNCATGQADESTNFDFGAADAGINRGGSGGSVVLKTDAGDALCVTSSAAVDVDVEVSYAQF